MQEITSAEEFKRLRESDVMEEYSVAANGHAEDRVWLEVIERYPEMREWVALNKTIPIQILKILARDKDDRVRAAVAMKRKLSIDLFESLALDDDEWVRTRIAYNAKVPGHVLKTLLEDSSEQVRDAASSRLKGQV